MDITYPFARVFTDKTNNLNVFFDESPTSNCFEQLKDIGKYVVEFCELDFSECLEELKKLDTKSVSSNFEDIKNKVEHEKSTYTSVLMSMFPGGGSVLETFKKRY